MALGGAWTITQIKPNLIRLAGRTFGAIADAAAIGLFGDGTADAQLPTGFTGSAGDGQGVPSAATLQRNCRVLAVEATDPSSANSAAVFQVTKNAVAPWQAVLTLRGQAAPTAPVTAEVYVEYVSP